MKSIYTLWLHSEFGSDPHQSYFRGGFGADPRAKLIANGYEQHPWPDDIPYTVDNVDRLRAFVRDKARVLGKIREDFAQLRAEIVARPLDPPVIPRDPYATIEWEP